MIIETNIYETLEERAIQFPRKLNRFELEQALVEINKRLGPPKRWSFVKKIPKDLSFGKIIKLEIIIFKTKKGINTQMEEALKKASVI